jgi:hypothetical protein
MGREAGLEPIGGPIDSPPWHYALQQRVQKASTDHRPPPVINKKTDPKSIDQSVRASWAIFQNPSSNRIGIFVVAMAVNIITISGTTAKRVNNPVNTSAPQPISKHPTNGANNVGDGMPIFSNRPAPTSAGNKNFCIPSDIKTAPTIKRMTITAAVTPVVSSFDTLVKSSLAIRQLTTRWEYC